MKGYTAIIWWGPSLKTMIWHVLSEAEAEPFDAAVGQWLMTLAGFTATPSGSEPAATEDSGGSVPLMQVRLDGKTLRGAKEAAGNQTHLLAALVDPDVANPIVGDPGRGRRQDHEVPMATTVLDQIDLTGKNVTADALNTVKATVDHIHQHGGHLCCRSRKPDALFGHLRWVHTGSRWRIWESS